MKLSEICEDCICLILEFSLSCPSEVTKYRTTSRFFFDLLEKNVWITRNVEYRILEFPDGPRKHVWKVSSYYKKQLRGRHGPWEVFKIQNSEEDPHYFPNLEDLEIYSHYTRSLVLIQFTGLKKLKNRFGSLSSAAYRKDSFEGKLPKFAFPSSLESLQLSTTDKCDFDNLSTLNSTNLKEFSMGGTSRRHMGHKGRRKKLRSGVIFPGNTLRFLYHAEQDHINNVLESLILSNSAFELNVFEDEIPKFPNLRKLTIGLQGNFRFCYVIPEVVQKLTGRKWNSLRNLEELRIFGGTDKGGIYCKYDSEVFETPLCCDQWGSYFPKLRILELTNIIRLEDAHVREIKSLEVLKIKGKTRVKAKTLEDYAEMKYLKVIEVNKKRR